MNRYLLAALLLAATPLHAQTTTGPFTVTLTPNKAVADAKLVPVFTWTSSPIGPTVCTASGGWSGVKAGAGTETLPQITKSASYSLTCSWPGTSGTVTVTWTPIAMRTDGSAVSIDHYTIVHGATAATMGSSDVAPGTSSSLTVAGLSNGTWFFAAVACDAASLCSDQSNVVSSTVSGAGVPTASASASITINAAPSPPVISVTVKVAEAFEVICKKGTCNVGRMVGIPELGAECVAGETYGDGYFRLKHPVLDVKYLPGAHRTARVAAQCG